MPKHSSQKYCGCGELAHEVCHTNFSGDHYYCKQHAQQRREEAIGEMSLGVTWEYLPIPRHPTTIEHWGESIQTLAEHLHRLRYDVVEEFYRHSIVELQRQEKKDWAKGRNRLASLLRNAARTAQKQRGQFARIWKLCQPYMQK